MTRTHPKAVENLNNNTLNEPLINHMTTDGSHEESFTASTLIYGSLLYNPTMSIIQGESTYSQTYFQGASIIDDNSKSQLSFTCTKETTQQGLHVQWSFIPTLSN